MHGAGDPVKTSVITSSYNQPRELDFVLCGISRQSVLPDEVLVADDGSKSETADVIEGWRAEIGCKLVHVRQADRGYRKARIVNEAVRRSGGEHLIFLDGDTFPHRHWIHDHLAAADGRRVLCGRRVKLGPAISKRTTREHILRGDFDHPLGALLASGLRGDTQRLGLGVRLPMPVARMLHPRPRRLMGVNFSLPRAAYEAVNGLDEEWTFYGREDLDLELRLKRAAWPFYPLLNRAVVFHVYHPERPRSEECRERVAAMENSSTIRCETGLQLQGPFDPEA
ncbi:MAG: glycosyltransferase involved in cell wall biosynthesis [Chlamydiales bacterium]|jgi:glycosyltransferase involved in cell wall biosynthesis